jgi:hypothetical protein
VNVAIIAGLVRSQIKRIDSFVREGGAAFLDNWEIIYIAARRNNPEIAIEDVNMIMEQAAQYERPHVIGVAKQDKRVTQRIEREIKQYFRFRWMDTRLLSYLGNDFEGFVVRLNDALAEDEIWSETIRPRDVRSPLLLPGTCFDTARPHREIWALCEQYGDIDSIEPVRAAIERFRSAYFVHAEHGNPRRWLDGANRVFDHTGPRHAAAPFPRNWKYSYRFEAGFHFDVKERNDRAFKFRDCFSQNHDVKANGYLNVDPHGYVRSNA